jgi:MoaA/NifB/PqqE/SkfB family radical SAM enzyme
MAIALMSGLRALLAKPVVDEIWYLQAYPDVRAAIENGTFQSGSHHYRVHGSTEGRLPSPAADPARARRMEGLRAIETNRLRVEQEIANGIVEVSSFPYIIQFSTEHRCNLRCVMCAATVLRNQGITPLMDVRLPENTLARFRKLEPYLSYFQTISLTGSGEPLLSPALPDILDMLSAHRNTSIGFTTHFQIFDRERAELLVRTGVQSITISMDGACKETYEKIRVNAKWEKLLRNIDLLNQVKSERQSSTPNIVFAANCMRQNIEELPDLIDFARTHGGYSVLATNTVIYDKAMQREALVHYPDLTRRMVTETIRRAQLHGILFDNRVWDIHDEVQTIEPDLFRSGIVARSAQIPASALPEEEVTHVCSTPSSTQPALSASGRVRTRPHDSPPLPPRPEKERADIIKACQMPWTGLMAESDGRVRVCCYTSPTVGNLNTQTLEEIWNGPPVQSLRRSFLAGRPPSGCRNCPIFTKTFESEDLFVQLMPSRFAAIEHPVEGAILHGNVEIYGWALDRELVSKIEIVINDITVGNARLGLERRDLERIYPNFKNSAKSGYSLEVDTRKIPDGFCMLAVRIFDGNGESDEYEHRTVEIRNAQPNLPGSSLPGPGF